MPVPLTQSAVNAATTQTRALIADGGQKGLYVDVRPTGKTFRYRFTDRQGKHRCVTVGDAALLKLQDARKLAKEMGRQALLGELPVKETKKKKAEINEPEHKPVMTLADFLQNRYMPFSKLTKRSHATEVSLIKHHILPDLGHRPFLEITKSELIAYLHEKLKTLKPGTTNRILNCLKVVYNTALSWEVEGLHKSPLQGIKQFNNNGRRERFLSKEEAASQTNQKENC